MRVEMGTSMVVGLIALGFGLYYWGKQRGREEFRNSYFEN